MYNQSAIYIQVVESSTDQVEMREGEGASWLFVFVLNSKGRQL